MLPETAGLRQHFQDPGHSFSLNGPTSQPITNIASGREIDKQRSVTSPIVISFYSGAQRCQKQNVDIDNSRLKKFIPHYKKLM